jgi:hypothetical protein
MNDEPSSVSHPVPGYPPSGLTDPERIALGAMAVAATMRAIDCDEDTARELLVS